MNHFSPQNNTHILWNPRDREEAEQERARETEKKI